MSPVTRATALQGCGGTAARLFGQRRDIAPILPHGGHHGGDPILLDTIFAGTPRPAHLQLPDSRAGALSCLTGIAARRSCEEKRTVRIADLIERT